MELKDYNYEVLQRNIVTDIITLRFKLSAIADRKWSTMFNRSNIKYSSESILDSDVILLYISTLDYKKNDFLQDLVNKMSDVNVESDGDANKISIYKRVLVPGICIVHDGLNSIGPNSELENFLKKVVNNQALS